MPIYAQATTETTPSEEKGIQQKDNTSPLLPVLLRAVSQLGVLKRLAGYLRRCTHRRRSYSSLRNPDFPISAYTVGNSESWASIEHVPRVVESGGRRLS